MSGPRLVVVLRHGGVPCVVPAERAGAAEASPSAPTIELWSRSAHAGGLGDAPRYLRVKTLGGDRSLACTELRVIEAPHGATVPLPPLVRQAIAAPFVSALVQIDGSLAWLIDPDGLDP
jgi:hypothetical protein